MNQNIHPHPASILSVLPYSRDDVCSLFQHVNHIKDSSLAGHHDKIILTAFFEASTRTRLSFESAALRANMKTLSIVDPKLTGMAKGESIEDIGHMLSGYADIVVVRHGDLDQFNRLKSSLSIPLINAGNGHLEHPTQALTDWYTLAKWSPKLVFGNCTHDEKIHLGIIGSPRKMRSVNSFLLLSRLFIDNIASITIISEQSEQDLLSPELIAVKAEFGDKLNITSEFDKTIKSLDVIYMNSIAFLDNQYELLGSQYQIKDSSQLKPSAVVLHPLARRDELSTTIDQTHHNLYFQQAHHAVSVRQALLHSIANWTEE